MYVILCTSITSGDYSEAALLFTGMLIIALAFSSFANYLTMRIFDYTHSKIVGILFASVLLIGFLFALVGPDLYIGLGDVPGLK